MSLKRAERNTTVITPPTPVCTKCGSNINTVFTQCTEAYFPSFIDEEGILHEHDANSHIAETRCDRGHVLSVKIDPPECPAKCGFGSPLGTLYHQMSS